MRLDHAIDQLSEIHSQVLRSEVFRGYRSQPMAATAVLALAAAAVQATLLAPATAADFALFWIAVAAFGAAICGCDLLRGSWRRPHAERSRLLQVVAQIAPAFAAGAVLPVALMRFDQAAVGLLPGLWALAFGLAVFSSRPFLRRGVGWVGLWYCAAGSVLVLAAEKGLPGPWGMGITFGIGQGLAAFALRDGPHAGRPGPGGRWC